MASARPVAASTAASHEPAGTRRPIVEFLGIGVQKAGTTWLHRALAAHPEVLMAEADDKDLRFFNAYYDRGYAWYERHFESTASKRRGEFSTSYFYSKDAPERVYRYNPSMRLILSLRDPVRRLISHHRHEIRVGRVSRDLSLAHAIEHNPSYVEQSRYFTQLSRWLEWFPLSSFHVVIFEEMFRDPLRTIHDLYAFIGASASFVPKTLQEKVNEGRLPRSLLLDRGARVISSTVRYVGGGRLVEWLKKAGAESWLKGRNTRPACDMEIDDALIERLAAEFAEENANLAALLGCDLSAWRHPASGARAHV